MTQTPDDWVPVNKEPQMWWRIVCTYDGKPGSVAAAVGRTAEEAKATFLGSLAEPQLAIVEEISPIGIFDVLDAAEQL